MKLYDLIAMITEEANKRLTEADSAQIIRKRSTTRSRAWSASQR